MAATARCACQQLSITPQTTHLTLTNMCIVYPLELGPDSTHVLHSIQCLLEFLVPKDSATACPAAQWAVSGIHLTPAMLPDCQPCPTTTLLPPHQHHHHQAGCYVMAGHSVFDVNGAVVSPLTRAGLRRATKGVCWGDNR